MNLALSDDQQFFQETTRKFLEQECRSPPCGRSPTTPTASTGPGGARGAELGWTSLLVARGRRRRQPQRRGPARPGASWPRRWAVSSRRARSLPTNVVAAAVGRGGHARAAAGGPARDRRRRDRRRVVHRRPGRRVGRRGRRGHRGRATATSSCSTASRRRSRRPAQADELLVTARTDRRAHPVPGPGRRRRGDGRAARAPSTSSAASPRCASTASRCRPRASSATSTAPTPTSSGSCSWRSSLQCAETVGALDRVFEFTARVRLATATRSAGRWRRTRRSSTASPT